MHKKLIDELSEEKLKEFVKDYISMLKGVNKDLYDQAESWLYKEVYGCHFSPWLAEEAVKTMANEDGTISAHWGQDQTTSAAKNYGIKFDHFNEYDWYYVMNMMYSDYCQVLGSDTERYVKMAKAFLCDSDAPEGKAYKYWNAMK